MATYKGRDVQVLQDITSPQDHKVMIQTSEGESKRVSKGEVTIFSADEVPAPVVDKDAKELSADDVRTAYYRKATPEDIKKRDQRQADKKAYDARLAQYREDGLTTEQITQKETEWHAKNHPSKLVNASVNPATVVDQTEKPVSK